MAKSSKKQNKKREKELFAEFIKGMEAITPKQEQEPHLYLNKQIIADKDELFAECPLDLTEHTGVTLAYAMDNKKVTSFDREIETDVGTLIMSVELLKI